MLSLALRLLLTAAAVAWVLSLVDLRDAGAVLASAPPWVYVLPPGLLVLNSAVHALRVRVLLQAAGITVPLCGVVAAMLQAAFVGQVLPRGGAEVAKIGFLTRLTGSAEASLAAILVARLLELIPWTLLLLWGLAWGLWAHDPVVGAAAAVFACAFSVVLATSLILVRGGDRLVGALPLTLRTLARRLPARLHRLARRLRAAFVQVGGDRPRLWWAGLLTVPFSLINCLVVWLIMRAHALPVGYLDALAVIPAVDTLIALPITIGGVGVREGLFVGLLAPWGATEAVAVAVALTRWSAELGRAAVGGVLFVVGGLSDRAEPST